MSPIAKKILAIYLLVVALGIALSMMIYLNGNQVNAATDSLVEDKLPQFNAISRLHKAILAQKPILYEYYANTNRDMFIKKFKQTQSEIETELHTIHKIPGGTQLLAKIESKNDLIYRLAEQLDTTLRVSSVDWDKARQLLEHVSNTEVEITPVVNDLVSLIQQQVKMSGSAAQSKTQFTIHLVIGFSVVIVLTSVLIGYYVNAYLRESTERRRLAMFAQRNPSPVMSLTWGGTVSYANQATLELRNNLGKTENAELLPPNFLDHLSRLNKSGVDTLNIEYKLQQLEFNCFIHALFDLRTYHVYLEDISEQKRAQEKLIHQAYHDDLTGLPNRRYLIESFDKAREQPNLTNMAVVIARVDRIKRILESKGYGTGDNLLCELAARLLQLLQRIDDSQTTYQLFRMEGASFGILIPHLHSSQQLGVLAENIHTAMTEPLVINGQELFFSLSLGASIFPLDGQHLEHLIRNAESAVNRVREAGGNAFLCYTQDMNAQTQRLLEMENGLRRALDKNELVLNYQPQFTTVNNQLIGVEALIRWHRDGKQMVSPAEFIPLAEESGLIIPIGEWVLRTACQQAKHWYRNGHAMLMAVNISARQFQHPDFVSLVKDILHESKLEPHHLELEITESVVMHDIDKTIAILNALRELGINLSIDDFGTGYSSLNYLKRFPIQKLKVDQSFVRNMTLHSNDAALTKSIIGLGQSLSLRVIAEGVETQSQLEMLQHFGCDEVQGYLFSKPVSSLEIDKLLKKMNSRNSNLPGLG